MKTSGNPLSVDRGGGISGRPGNFPLWNCSAPSGARRHRVGLWRYVLGGGIATLLTAPLIYSVGAPFLLLDAWVTLYQAACFRAWGIAASAGARTS